MFDIHSHILPGIDDGAKDLNESLALLKMAQNDGITHMVATPHIHIGRFNNSAKALNNDIDVLKREALNAGIDLKLAVAAEVRLDIELMAMVIAGQLPFIGALDSVNYLLLELPHSHVPQGYDKFINWLSKQNIKAIIPHPERNRDIQANPFYIERLKQLGCDFQLTASSIEGAWGDTAKAISIDMLQKGLVSYVASDAHSVKRRPPLLSNAKRLVTDLIGEQEAQNLFVNNPRRLTESLFDE
ncbi:tyrosine-protein phosphatase [Pseudoalteromonas sp. Angola-4]|uniref:tyrosine-protein phosphatase n=1 Tax=Pseudoalteromonas sp. Angola-4 TaxID=3025335 RepID=UPI002359D450|nr:CpsB/CapC family capsule biosynthesis tyrosine phosphatase [Pseudoalteromonas sp. Angola-4]MDC9509363.1 capsule biosynthesis protein CapC [Pseudoalteromonas sp. Angola-4]